MKALILLVCIALGLGYLAFDRHHKLEREKFLAAEKIRIRAEEERRREEQRREEERKQKLEKYTLQIKENEKQIALMHQQLEELNQKLDKAKSARNHEPLAFDERRTLQREISTLKYEQKKLHNNFRNNAGFNKMLRCYDHCIRMHQIKFRIQMGDHFEKKTLNGVYRKRYRRYSDSRYYRHKRHHRGERIYWYDGNGYWIVTFTCNEHGNTWTGEKAQEYQRLLEEYQNGHRRNDADQYRRRYIALEKLIRQKQQQLDKSFKTPDPNERTENIAALNRQYRRISSEIDRKKNEISRLNRLISRSEN